MKKERKPVTIEEIKNTHRARGAEIRRRLADFAAVWSARDDRLLWEEMVFCFFTGGCSARMGLRSIEAVRPLLQAGNLDELSAALSGVHRYPFARAGYIVSSREFLQADCQLRLCEKLSSFDDDLARRDWLVREKGIKGLGYKEASHFLRNVGFRGYAILDKHVLRSMAELGVIESPEPPSTRAKYLAAEQALKKLSRDLEIDFDELDLVLWSLKTGEILK